MSVPGPVHNLFMKRKYTELSFVLLAMGPTSATPFLPIRADSETTEELVQALTPLPLLMLYPKKKASDTNSPLINQPSFIDQGYLAAMFLLRLLSHY